VVAATIRCDAEVVNLDQTGVIQTRDGAGLGAKSLPGLGASGSLLWNQLQGNLAPEIYVDRLPHLTHPPARERPHESVPGSGEEPIPCIPSYLRRCGRGLWDPRS